MLGFAQQKPFALQTICVSPSQS